jgi:hypothetical protein
MYFMGRKLFEGGLAGTIERRETRDVIDIELLNLVWRKYSFPTPSSDLGTCHRPTHWEKDSWRTVT